MLDTYRKMEALGVIGKMQKIDANGRVIEDMRGDQAGTLVTRPFQEFPKVVRRHRAPSKEFPEGVVIETIVGSKNEELKLLAESPDNFDIPLSPLERERNELAQENAQQSKTIDAMQRQMATMMEQVAALSQKIDKDTTENIALGEPAADHKPVGKTLEALALGKKA